jgi:excisionase family DNA binding protein
MSNVVALVTRARDHDLTTDRQPAVYSVVEVAQLLSLSRGTAYALVRAGTIPALRLGNRWVIPRGRFHTWLDSLDEEQNGGKH